jgi:lipopolysaccharide transport system permease protein
MLPNRPLKLNTPVEIRIRSNRSWLRIEWREIWEYRDLLYLLVRRDFVAKYKQTILGPAWFVIQPLTMTLMFTIVFGHVAGVPTDGLPPILFYLCNMVAWGYFAQNLTAASTTFTANAHLFGKVYFPRLIVPLATCISNMFAFAIQLATFLGFLGYYKFFANSGVLIQPKWIAFLAPVAMAYAGLLSLGVSLWMSALTAKYRDFTHLMTFLTQVWLYATPVVWPFSQVPEKWRWLAALNPMSVVVEWFRWAFLGEGVQTATMWTVSGTLCGLVLLTGILLFQRTARTFIDTV